MAWRVNDAADLFQLSWHPLLILRVLQSRSKVQESARMYWRQFTWSVQKCGLPRSECFCMTVSPHISSSPCSGISPYMVLPRLLNSHKLTLCKFASFCRRTNFKAAAEDQIALKITLCERLHMMGFQECFKLVYECWQTHIVPLRSILRETPFRSLVVAPNSRYVSCPRIFWS